MLERVVILTGPGRRQAWDLALHELAPNSFRTIYAGPLRLTHAVTAKPDLVAYAETGSWSAFREAVRLLDRSETFTGYRVLRIAETHSQSLDLDTRAQVFQIHQQEALSRHQRFCAGAHLLSALGCDSSRFEALIQGEI